MGLAFVNKLSLNNKINVWNRTERSHFFKHKHNINKVNNLHELFQNSEIIFVCISGDKEIYDYIFDLKNFSHDLKNKTIIDFSTIEKETAIYLHHSIKENYNSHYVESPVSGGPEGVETGSISCIFHCDKIHKDFVTNWLEKIFLNFYYLPYSGMPQSIKVLNNLLESIHLLAASEVIGVSKELGLDLVDFKNSINILRGNSVYFNVLIDRIINSIDSENISATINTRIKDLDIVSKYCHSNSNHFLKLSYKLFCEAKDKGFGNKDQTYIYNYLNSVHTKTKRVPVTI